MTIRIECKECNNIACFIKQHCTPVWLNKIESKKIQIDHQTKDFIFKEGGSVQGMFFIQQGKVKIVAKGPNKREYIVRLATDGHILGHRGFGNDIYPVSAKALCDTKVCFINNKTLYGAFLNNPKLTLRLVEFYSRELRKIEIRMKYLLQMNVKEKMAEALLYIKQIFGINSKDNTINVHLSRQEIADMTGVTTEQVSREFGEFMKKMLIEKKGKGIVLLNESGLRYIVEKYGIEQYAEQI